MSTIAERKNSTREPSSFGGNVVRDIGGALTIPLADVFALYFKTTNFHWHMSGRNFRGYHLMLDEHSDELFAMTNTIAERVRKIGGGTPRSIGDIGRRQRILDNDADYVTPKDMLAELRDDNQRVIGFMRAAHSVCNERGDIASASLLESWIEEAERRVWFLYETLRN
jgi:starvation-inducible DNA-binding protein